MKSLMMITAALLTMVTINAQAKPFCMKEFMNQNVGRFADTTPDLSGTSHKSGSTKEASSQKAGRKW